MFHAGELFASPAQVNQRRYEAIRAYLYEGAPMAEAAARFGYTRSALASLVRDFRAGKLTLFAEPAKPGHKSWDPTATLSEAQAAPHRGCGGLEGRSWERWASGDPDAEPSLRVARVSCSLRQPLADGARWQPAQDRIGTPLDIGGHGGDPFGAGCWPRPRFRDCA